MSTQDLYDAFTKARRRLLRLCKACEPKQAQLQQTYCLELFVRFNRWIVNYFLEQFKRYRRAPQ
jgi:hypothetical protein